MTDEELAAQKIADEKKAAELAAAEATKKKEEEDAKKNKQPSDEEARLLKEVMQKKEKLDAANKEVERLTGLAKQLESLGGLDAITALVSAQKDAETKQLEAKGEWDRLKNRMAEEHTKVVKTLETSTADVLAKLSAANAEIDNLTIGSAFSGSEYIKVDLLYTPTKMRALYGAHFDRVDGKIVGFDKPRGESNRTQIVDASGNAIPFEDALKKIVAADPDRDHMLRSKTKAGSGSGTRQGQQSTKVEQDSKDKIRAGLAAMGVAV